MIFSGLLAYPITPTDSDGGLDLDSLGLHVAELAGSGVSGISVLGSSGSFPYLNRGERALVVRTAVDAAAGLVPVIAGVSSVGTREILEHVADAEAAGAQGVLLSTVSYHPLTDKEVLNQTRIVASSSALPICVYQNVRATRYEFALDVVAELAGLPTVVGFKDNAATAGEFAARQAGLAAEVPAGFSHGLSGDLMIAAGTAATAWHSGPAAVVPELYLAVRAAVGAGDPAAVAAASARLTSLVAVLATLPKGAVLHSLARLCGVRTGPPRLPLLPLDAAEELTLALALEAAGIS
ncbi:dihydrodipicolinate synthase family protein [Micrococcaceae bacterium Sec5.7]